MLGCVAPEYHEKIWPLVEGFLTDAGTPLVVVKELLDAGTANLIVCEEDGVLLGACAVSVVEYPTYRAVNVLALGGKNLLPYWGEFKELLKSTGASKIEGLCSRPMARMVRRLGMGTAYEMVRGDL